jgi:hypothetical protein
MRYLIASLLFVFSAAASSEVLSGRVIKVSDGDTVTSLNIEGPQVKTNLASEDTFGKCGSKKYCKEMSSCAEAKFYLTQCGLSRLDRDGDGIPCESLCR